MEIVTLRFVISEDDLNSLLARFVPVPAKVRDLHLRVIPNGLSLAGVYVAILPIPFHTEWKILVEAGKVAAQLSDMNAVGVGFGFLKSYLLKLLSSNSAVLKPNEESLVFDVDLFLEGIDFPIKTNLTSVSCDGSRLVIECDQQVS